MLKIGNFFYIHFTTLFLLAVSYFNRNLEILAVSYGVIFIHEMAHLLAAVLIGLKPSHVIFFPFGVNLKLKNSVIYSISDEIILYLAGPLSNIVMALFALKLKASSLWWELFYYNNLCHFIFNMLPVLPMDGGVVLKKIMSHYVGTRRAEMVLRLVSAILIGSLVCVESYVLAVGKFNFSVLFTAIFLTANLFTNREKYHIDFVKELMFYKNKDSYKFKRVGTYILKERDSLRQLAKRFVPGRHYAVFCEDEDGNITKIMTERQIIEGILKNDAG